MEENKKPDVEQEVTDQQAEETPVVEEGFELSAEAEVEKLKADLETATGNHMRLQAEFMNYKKRVEKEKADIYRFANEKIVRDLLDVLDNLDRALESISGENTDHSNVLNGVEMIRKSFSDLLEKEGVKAIDAVGQPFDPNMHHAVMTEPKDDCDADVVIEEFQKGYKLNDRVVRPSMVKVSC